MDNSNNPLTSLVEGFVFALVAVMEVLIVGLVEAIVMISVGWIDALLGGGRRS